MKKLVMTLALIGAGCAPALSGTPALAAASSPPTSPALDCQAPDVSTSVSRNGQVWQGNVKLIKHNTCGTEAIVLCEFAPTGSTFMAPIGADIKQVGDVSSSSCLPGWIVKSVGYRWWNGQTWVL